MPPVPNVPPDPEYPYLQQQWHQATKYQAWYPKDCVPGPLPINLPSAHPPRNLLRRHRPDQQQRPAPYPPAQQRPAPSYSNQMTSYSQPPNRPPSRSRSRPPQRQLESYSNPQPQIAPTHSQPPNGPRSRSSSRPPHHHQPDSYTNPQPQHDPNHQQPTPTQAHHSHPPNRSRSHSSPPARDTRSRSRNSRPATPTRSRSRSPYPRREDDGRRAFLKDLANDTIKALNNNFVDVSITQHHTQLFLEDSHELMDWRQPRSHYPPFRTKFDVQPLSTLKGARRLYDSARSGTKIGVLNFASATSPGGGFLNGARAQEESIARSSSLYVSLTTDAARPFYALHAGRGEHNGFYTHAMIYSPEVHLFRDDDGTWLDAIPVDIVTSPAVNAGKLRRRYLPTSGLEWKIEDAMRERMARILALFEMKGATSLVLGSFGTGVFQNDVGVVARIWRDLLRNRGARFRSAFKEVTFCIPDAQTKGVFEAALFSRGGGRGPYVPVRGGDGVGVS